MPAVSARRAIGFPGASEKFCTLAPPSWRLQWSQAHAGTCLVDVEVIFTNTFAKMCPFERASIVELL
jgi:hypothetical protein